MTSASEPLPPLKGEVRSLTGLRIFAALWVVLFHFSFTPGLPFDRLWGPMRAVVHHGALGVDLFYVLSGFVITLTYLEKMGPRPGLRGTVGFWWARLARVWPVYALITTAFGGWLLYKMTRTTDGFLVWQNKQPKVDGWHYLEQLTMMQLWHRPYFDGASWDGPAWSISAEWAAYTAFFLVVLGLWKLRNLPPVFSGLLATACMVPFAYVCLRTGSPYYPFSWVPRIFGGFLAGSLTYLAVRRMRMTRRTGRVAAATAVVALLAILLLIWWGWRYGGGQGEYGGVVVVLFPLLVGSLALSRSGLSRLLSTGPLVHGGRISYSLYLIHVPIFEIFWTEMGWHRRIAPGTLLSRELMPLVPLVALLMAHIAYRFVEEPARVWLRGRGLGRWAQGKRSPRPEAQALPTSPWAEGTSHAAPVSERAPVPVPASRASE